MVSNGPDGMSQLVTRLAGHEVSR